MIQRRRGNKANIRLRLICTTAKPGSKYHVFSKPLEVSDFVIQHKGFIGKSNPELDELKSNF